eukprot:462870-Pyramimonas_sp.AAC.1
MRVAPTLRDATLALGLPRAAPPVLRGAALEVYAALEEEDERGRRAELHLDPGAREAALCFS